MKQAESLPRALTEKRLVATTKVIAAKLIMAQAK